MTSTRTHSHSSEMQQPSALSRTGYLIAIAVNAVWLYVVHHLLDWGWPNFLTTEFDSLLDWMTISIGATIAANIIFLWFDPKWFKSLAEAVTAGLSLIVAVRTWQVFPFDFSGYEADWSWLVRMILVFAILGTGIAVLVNSVKAFTAGSASLT